MKLQLFCETCPDRGSNECPLPSRGEVFLELVGKVGYAAMALGGAMYSGPLGVGPSAAEQREKAIADCIERHELASSQDLA